MKKTILAIMGALVLLAAPNIKAQEIVIPSASRNYIQKDIPDLPNFEAVSVVDNLDVQFYQSTEKESQVYIYGSDNILDLVQVTVADDTLQVRFAQPTRIIGERRLKIVVKSPKLSRVLVQNDGDFKLYGPLNTENLDLQVVGNGDISISSVKAKTLTLRADGEGDIDVDFAEVQNLNAYSSGKADIKVGGIAVDTLLQNDSTKKLDAEKLKSTNVKAITNNSGDIKCFAVERLDVQASGKGRVVYKGFPSQINRTGNLKSIKQN